MEKLNQALVPQVKRPQNIRVMQFGEGGFLRAFVDEMLDNLNTQCGGDYGVAIVQPLERGMCKMLEEQDCLYTVMLRGREESGDVKKVKVVGTVLKTTMGYAVVKEAKFGHTQTPTVCVFGTLAGEALEHPFTINLSKCAPGTIVSVLEELELTPLMFRMHVNPARFLKETK